jgi:antitoxin component of MazEF toxin-antitoxin module
MSAGKECAGSAKVQSNRGSVTVTIPKDVAEELGITKGDRVWFRCREGSESGTIASTLDGLANGD